MQTPETINQQNRADDQDERERHFRDEQSRAQPASLATSAAARGILQRIDRIAPRCVQCGHEAENDAGNQRETDGEQQHVDVERNFAHARQEILRDFFQQIEPPDRKQDAEDAGDRRGQHTLGE